MLDEESLGAGQQPLNRRVNTASPHDWDRADSTVGGNETMDFAHRYSNVFKGTEEDE